MITVRLPDGREIQVNTDDPKAASAAAKKYVAASAKPAPEKPKSFGEKVWGTMTDAAADLAETSKPLPQGRNPFKDPVGAAKDIGAQIKRDVSIPVKAFNLLASPITGVVEAGVVEPYGGAMSTIFKGTDAADWEGDMRTALSAARVARPSAPRPAKVPSPARVARAERLESFDRAGVTPSLAAIDGGAASKAANAIAENPVGFRVRANLKKSVDDAGASAGRIAGEYGEARGRQITGENVQSGVKRFAKGDADTPRPTSPAAPAKASSFSVKAESLYDDAFLPIETAEAQAVARAETELAARQAASEQARSAAVAKRDQDYNVALQEEQQRVALLKGRGYGNVVSRDIPKPDLPPVAEVSPQRPAVQATQTVSTLREMSGRVNAPRLSNMITDGRIKSILGALEEDGAAVRFNDLRALRTWVRNAQRDPALRQGIEQGQLQRLEGALTGDVYANAERLGGREALGKLQRADTFYRAGSQRIQRALQPFADAKSGEGAYSRITQAAGSTSSADAQKVLALKRTLAPEEWGDVVANIVTDLGRPTKGATGSVGGEGFSVANFVSNYNAMSPRGREVIFGSVGGGGARASSLRSELDNLARVADRLKAVEKGANASNSMVSGQNIATVGGVMTAPVVAGQVLGGLMLTGEALTNPAVVRWMSRIAQAETKSPKEVSVVVKQLEKAAQANAALMPLYQESQKLLLVAPRVSEAATAEEEPQPARP